LDLPLFAAFPLVETETGRAALRRYWLPYLELAEETHADFVVDTATWRANRDWAAQLGYDPDSLYAANAMAARFAHELATQIDHALINGVVGPRGDGYVVGEVMSSDEAAEYHRPQVAALADAGVDQVSAITFTYTQEAVGFVQAATSFGVPAVVSFTVETDGRLPSGQPLREAVETVDQLTDAAASGFMINCAHPTHFEQALVDGDWLRRLTGVRANASAMSHAELDAADELDDGDPVDLAVHYRDLKRRLPELQTFGGCCGTDHRHIRAISDACRTSG
jgi:homocysteine S-methyltransferase